MSRLRMHVHGLAVFVGAFLIGYGLNLSFLRTLAVFAGLVLLIEFWGKS